MSDYILPQELILLVPFLNIIGIFLKRSPAFPDWLIPDILAGIGILFALFIEISKNGFNFASILTGVINGVIAAGIAVFGHQVVKQNIERIS